MTTNRAVPPPLVSLPRITTLVASLLVSLGSGTNYAYSAYSPQLGSKLGISHTQLNIVALSGNVGVYISSPLWGKIVDSRGPRILLGCAFTSLLTGYMGMRYLYEQGLPDGVLHLSTMGIFLLAAFCLLTGAGGSAGSAASVNSTAKTFPDKVRASTTGLVISGFGLSAFFFSNIAHFLFPGDTSSFFLVLALGTSIPMIIGSFLVRPIPLPQQEGYHIIKGDTSDEDSASTALLHHHDTSNTHLPDSHDREAHITTQPEEIPLTVVQDPDDLDSSNGDDRSTESGQSLRQHCEPTADFDNLPNLYGKKLLKSIDFWLLCSILSILGGTGLMYINNVGSMSQVLYAYNTHHYDDTKAAGWQTAQVSTFSLSNFLGRIFIGLISDFAKSKYDMPRSYCLVLVSSLFCISQLVIATVNDISRLWLVSSLLGLAYGSVYSLFPTVCIEWFGMPHFSENWGFMVMSPLVAGNFFCLIFGRNLDAHEHLFHPSSLPQPSHSRLAATVLSAPLCLEGRECYIDTIYLTTLASLAAILLSVWAGYRDRKKIMAYRRRHSEVGS